MSLEPIKLPKQFKNTPDQCDAALGAYMRAWSNLELQIFRMFHKLVDTNIVTSQILFNAVIDQRTVRNILEALGKERLRPSDFQKLERIVRRMKDASTIRNRLIHGRWQINLDLKKGTREAKTAEWVRFYSPVDPEILQKIHGKKPNQRLLAAHQFTLKQIIQRAADADRIAHDVNSFIDGLSLVPARTPQPIF